VILTHDQDFNTILALSQRAKPGVVLLRTSLLRLETVGERVWQANEAALPDLEAEVGYVLWWRMSGLECVSCHLPETQQFQ